jgi:hypothetical protein
MEQQRKYRARVSKLYRADLLYRCRSIHCHVHCFSSSVKPKPNSQNIAQAGWLSAGLASIQGSTMCLLEDTLLYVATCPLMAHERRLSFLPKLRKHLTATKQLFIFWSQCITLCMCMPQNRVLSNSAGRAHYLDRSRRSTLRRSPSPLSAPCQWDLQG